ncbi:acyl-CoA thioesterase [Pelotomaculum terephthalicicum JT]|uniref:acyl-CoA thioesterase n=1 Tax=Pelotomaculum TaxID=191373 RepID=UPI0009CE8F15|nr:MULTISPECIES: acyl-CoA thioesterase [Pelotomaculum]MCG9968711.1 acyl-CoA thioesterase [Pelotomaculum terephthalicicum JT]OPX86997.1 MAG: Long-chain acyl-CoA thioesterase FadM [Pelotomaculum sp. PtaB.Bin117]
MNGYAHKLERRIDWFEVDFRGHVNNVSFIYYIQEARVELLHIIGLMQSQAKEKEGPVLASITCQYYRPLFYPGKIYVYSKVSEIKNTSFVIKHAIYNERNQMAAEAQDILVYYDFVKETKLTITDEPRKKLEKISSGNIVPPEPL